MGKHKLLKQTLTLDGSRTQYRIYEEVAGEYGHVYCRIHLELLVDCGIRRIVYFRDSLDDRGIREIMEKFDL
jgi:hypothetical protein